MIGIIRYVGVGITSELEGLGGIKWKNMEYLFDKKGKGVTSSVDGLSNVLCIGQEVSMVPARMPSTNS